MKTVKIMTYDDTTGASQVKKNHFPFIKRHLSIEKKIEFQKSKIVCTYQ